MSLAPGVRLGVYEVVSLIGAGGMGEVYRARDTRLQRDVALKVLPEVFAADPERLARFEREARLLASLKHANIATIHGIEEGNPSTSSGQPAVRALVLELVEGETLQEILAGSGLWALARLRTCRPKAQSLKPKLPLEEALTIARQIAEALEAAHEQGVIHRDLKPANIKITPEGTVKVLDFGLAKALAGEVMSADLSQSPTLTVGATRAGVIIGTAAYMSPEQARGRAVDKRADMWAFGCVLYELLTGKRAFGGEDISETLAEVIKGEPDWKALPLETPLPIRRLLRRCLAKDRKGRIADASIARIEIDEALSGPASSEATPAAPVTRRPMWLRVMPLAAAVLATALVTGLVSWRLNRVVPLQPPTSRFVVDVPPGVLLQANASQRLAISRDGRNIIYSARRSGVQQLYLRPLEQLDSVPIRGIDTTVGSLFLSPDGEWVGYNDTASGAFKKIRVSGGPPATICEARAATGGFRGATWGTNGLIVFSTGADPGLMQVPDAGGMPQPLTTPQGEIHKHPHFLPDAKALLFTVQHPEMQDRIAVISLDTHEQHVLVPGNSPRFASSGHLVFLREGALWAVGFDRARLQIVGNPVPMLEGVGVAAGSNAALFDLDATGSLIYSPAGSAQAERTLVWVDRQGQETPIPAPPRAYDQLRISPDGARLALHSEDQERDILLWDLVRGGALTRLTFDPRDDLSPVWTSDSRRLIFSSLRTGVRNLFAQAADGTGTVERLTESPNLQNATSISPDGTRLVFTEIGGNKTGRDVMQLRLDGAHQITPLVQTPFTERNAEISPDGRWLVYEANDSGSLEIYVRPFPDVASGRWQISTGGGTHALWARSGAELFYLAPSGALMRVGVTPGTTWAATVPAKLLEGRYYTGVLDPRSYDIAPDGRRFLMIKDTSPDKAAGPQLILVQNWFEELKQKVPVR